jgi:CheY-like chemotaxis protein
MDGPETLVQLKQNLETASIPVIFLTASIQTDETEAYKKLAVVGIIHKPFDPMTLAEQLSNLVQYL